MTSQLHNAHHVPEQLGIYVDFTAADYCSTCFMYANLHIN